MSWDLEFDVPITLPSGEELATLRDAGKYVAELSRSAETTPEWQAAMRALLQAAELNGPVMHARIGIMKALNR